MRLVVAAEDTERLGEALRVARQIADGADDHVMVLHIVHPYSEASTDEELFALLQERETEFAKAIEALDPGVRVHIERLVYGEDVPGAIVRNLREAEADFVLVMSSRAAGLQGMLLGSVAQDLLRECPCPVIVVRPPDDEEQRGR